MNPRRSIRNRPRPLRGETLIKAAHAELARLVKLSPKTDPINVLTLARQMKVTRQALYNNNLDSVVREFAELQRKNFSAEVKTVSLRRPLEQRIQQLEEDNAVLQRKIDGWIERWVAVEYNARLLGIDADKLFQSISRPQRKLLVFRSGKRLHP